VIDQKEKSLSAWKMSKTYAVVAKIKAILTCKLWYHKILVGGGIDSIIHSTFTASPSIPY